MFEPTVAFADGHGQKPVLVHRGRFAKKPDVLFADPSQIFRKLCRVGFVATADRDMMRHVTGIESDVREIGNLEGMVDQFIVTGGTVAAKTGPIDIHGRHRRCDAKVVQAFVLWSLDQNFRLFVFEAVYFQKHTGPVEERTGRIEIGATH